MTGPRLGKVGTLTGLNVYPVKSLKGIAAKRWPVAANGLLYDRRWMVVDVGGRQLTQRELPRMSLIETSLTPPALQAEGACEAGQLVLIAPGSGSVELPVGAPGAATSVRVWDDEVEATESPAEVDRWLTGFLEVRARLVRFACADEVPGRPWQRVAFPDSLPFLVIGQASLDDLNRRLHAAGRPEVEMNRFRPNLVITGSPAFAEDGWRRLTIGELGFTVRKPCGRCVITTIDQATAAVGREPLATLSRYRTSNGKVMFGQKLIHDRPGELSIADEVCLLESVPDGERMRFEARQPVAEATPTVAR